MKAVIILLLLGQAAQPAPKAIKPCVIVAMHKKTGGDFTRWTVPKPYDYIEGEFPAGLKFRHELNDKHVREIQDKGGKVVIVKSDYVLADLEDARSSCKK